MKKEFSLLGIFSFIFLILNSSEGNFAQTKKNESSSVPLVMYDFLGGLMSLQPYMVSSQKFSDPRNSEKIEKYLFDLSSQTKRLSHSQRLNTATFQVSAELLQSHLAKVQDLFIQGRKEYARKMLNATMDGCSSCHAQVPAENNSMWKFRANEIKGNDFEKAEFLFALRHYDEALQYYDKAISNYHPKHDEFSYLETALKRKLAIYIRAKQSPKLAVESFKNDLHNKKWKAALKSEVSGWVSALNKITPQKNPSVSAKDLGNFASNVIPPLLTAQAQFKPGSYVLFLYVSGLIYQFINTHKQAELTPELFYWLAVCDIHLSQSYFFSLADLYLKECIKRFPSSPVAEKCYAELESTTLDSYTGSSGIHMPEEVKKELKTYKSMLKQTL
ncbi:MAG: hypothetical protein J0L93_08245 [Deltaproteobacteria bacterium]|nr:hypothetical protein [Deltaproteobacteria bacterium]